MQKKLAMGRGEEVDHHLRMKSVSKASVDCLPDELLVQIMSFLPTKQAALTSILSKKWRTLFAFLHTLDFDDSIFSHPQDFKQFRNDIRKSFRDFVDRTLAFQSGNHLNKFSLKYTAICKDGKCTFDRWICNALQRGVSELHLGIKSHSRSHFPSKVFTSTTLVKLSLVTNLDIDSFPSNTSLPALKVLFLDSFVFKIVKLSDVFVAACPVLEDLTVQGKSYPHGPEVISSKTIKRLSISLDRSIVGLYVNAGIISFDTPNLVDLYYADYARLKSPHCNLESLSKATLDLYFLRDDNQQGPPDVTDLINGIRNVKTLHLTSSSVEVISICCRGGLPVFNNLVDLFFSSTKRGWKVFLPLLLERSPNLKKLSLSGLDRYTFRRQRFVGIPIPPNNQVKMLCIMHYGGSASELKHIGHFLRKMESLEMVRIKVAATAMDGPNKVQQLTEDLLKLPTASSKLKIQVV